MDRAELPITGYLDRFSRRPGERFTAHVSLDAPGPARARLVRVISGDPNPEGPGLRTEDLSGVFDITFDGLHQPVALGSHALIPRAPARPPDGACTWTVLAWSQAPGPSRAVLSERDDAVAVTLLYGRAGAEAELVWPGGSLRLATGLPATPHGWCRLWLSVHPATGRVTLGQRTLRGLQAVATGAAPGVALPAGGAVLIAAANPGAPERHYTGRLENPAILDGSVEAWSDPLVLPALSPLAIWDFAEGIDGLAVTDAGPQGCHGTLVNLPTRGVAGARWSGAEQFWRHAPQDYAAIHFHDDDLEDCGWAPSFTFDVPNDLASGSYALHLTTAGGEDWLPFYVLPKREGPFARIAVLASTFTYQAYANHARGNADADYHARVAAWGAYPHNPDAVPNFAHSTYNRHSDGSGVCFSSRLRPILNMRPGFVTFNDPRGSGLRHYAADTHLLAWLDAQNAAFDVITDEDLDDEGAALLAPYRVVLTGSHPGYHTPATLDALQHFVDHGGRLAYLGGHGFYWRIARSKALPHVIEVRRAEGGIRAWAAEPGEYYHMLDGGYGGLWRRNRRPPQLLAGVGFSAQGSFESTHYRRLPVSYEPRFSWMFEGVETDILGDRGLSGGGAAGYEMDRADISLGTPADAVILARSEQPPASLVTVPEELLSHLATVNGEPPEALKRCEMVYFDTPSGGAVFSAGSATFCGSLWQNGAFQGPVSQLLYNVVRRFMTWRVGDAALHHAPPGARG